MARGRSSPGSAPGRPTRRAATRGEADRLLDRIDWSALAGILTARRLLPLLGERIAELAGQRAPGVVRRGDAGGDTRPCAEVDGLLELLSIQLFDALAADGIPSLPLKGPALGQALYGTPGRRPSADIDLLVRAEDLDRGGRRRRASRVPRTSSRTGPASDCRCCTAGSCTAGPACRCSNFTGASHWYEQLFSREMLLGQLSERRGRQPGRTRPMSSPRCCCSTPATGSSTSGSRATSQPGGMPSAAQLPPGTVAEQIAALPGARAGSGGGGERRAIAWSACRGSRCSARTTSSNGACGSRRHWPIRTAGVAGRNTSRTRC